MEFFKPSELLLPYYLVPMFWVSLALVLLITTLVGKYLEPKRKEVV